MFNTVERIDDFVPIRRALVSVFDKTGLDDFVGKMLELNTEASVYSTGGTHAFLRESLGPKASGRLVSVADYTNQPEMQGGLVKTLDFKIYLGLLSEPGNEDHRKDLERTGGIEFDLVAVNLYPFKEARAKAGSSPEEIRANIDIGGPCMLRAAAKNFLRVAAVCDPDDYSAITAELAKNGACLSFATRAALARKTFSMIAEYDAAIAAYFGETDSALLGSPYQIERKRDVR